MHTQNGHDKTKIAYSFLWCARFFLSKRRILLLPFPFHFFFSLSLLSSAHQQHITDHYSILHFSWMVMNVYITLCSTLATKYWMCLCIYTTTGHLTPLKNKICFIIKWKCHHIAEGNRKKNCMESFRSGYTTK